MQEIASTRFSVSYHMKDLLKRDPEKVREICNWLETHAETKRDRANRSGSRRMMARLIAARQLLKAATGESDGESVMNRTEGKVVDKVIYLDANRLVEQLEAARQRVLHHQQSSFDVPHNLLTLTEQHTDSMVLAGHALDQQSSACQGQDTPGGNDPVPSGGLAPMAISPLAGERADEEEDGEGEREAD